MTLKISPFVQQLITIAKDDVAKDLLPAAAAFCTSLASNPSKLNLAIQVGALEVAAFKALPDIEKDELTALAQVFTTEAEAAIAAAPGAAPAVAAVKAA